LIAVRTRAENAIGVGAYSQVNVEGSLIETEPGQVFGLVFDMTTSTITTVDLSWQSLLTMEETGGSEILNYIVLLSSDQLSWSEVSTVSTTYMTITELAPGQDYYISVKAVNIHGQGPQSTSLVVKAA
jgi:predicted phage tail protein